MFRNFPVLYHLEIQLIITVFRSEEFSSFLIRDGIGDIVEVHLSNVWTAHEIDKKLLRFFFILCVFRDDPGVNPHVTSFFWNDIFQVRILKLTGDSFSRVDDSESSLISNHFIT